MAPKLSTLCDNRKVPGQEISAPNAATACRTEFLADICKHLTCIECLTTRTCVQRAKYMYHPLTIKNLGDRSQKLLSRCGLFDLKNSRGVQRHFPGNREAWTSLLNMCADMTLSPWVNTSGHCTVDRVHSTGHRAWVNQWVGG